MGFYTDYLNQNMSFDDICKERKKWLKEISKIREGRDILVYASALNKRAQISIDNQDIMPFEDMLSSSGNSDGIDIIIQTPGGVADVVEKLVKLLRNKYSDVAIIVPGMAMSAGTIFTMAANEILMGKTSSLGPIDAQIFFGGRFFSADAFLEGLEKIKKETEKTGKLNQVYIPILQNISIGEIEAAENAQKLSATLVEDWLVKYKFSKWVTHSSTGNPVKLDEKKTRAKEIAKALGKNSKWLVHGRPIGIQELRELKLQITDYTENQKLCEGITRYFILLTLTFDVSSIYKLYETSNAQIYKFDSPSGAVPILQQGKQEKRIAKVDYQCPRCGAKYMFQGNFEPATPLQEGSLPFPPDNRFLCPNCKTQNDLLPIRMNIEVQTKMKLL